MKFPIRLSPARTSISSVGFTAALLAFVLGCLWAASLSAQTVTFTGATSSVDFGTANLCRAGQDLPVPCSKTVSLDYKVTAGGNLGTPKVLTQGYADLDFTLANGTTCAGGVITGETCAVNVTFAPRFPGTREGGVLIVDEHGNVLATTYLYGTGNGPQIGFTPGTVITNPDILSSFGAPSSFGAAVIDGEGNLIEVSPGEYPLSYSYLEKIPADGGPPTQIPAAGAYSANAVAIDGVGNLYVMGDGLLELPAGGGSVTGVNLPSNVSLYIEQDLVMYPSIDKFGDVLLFGDDYFEGPPMPSMEVIIPPGGGTSTVNYFSSDLYGALTFLASDPAGNIFASGHATGPIVEYTAGSVTGKPLPFTFPSPYQEQYGATVDAVGNVYATDLIAYPPFQYGVLELPLGSGPQVAVPVPTSTQGLLVGPNGDFFADGFEVVRSVPSPLNFGSLPIGGTKTLPLGITNTGNQPLVIKPYYESPSYKILSTTPSGCESATAPGATCTLNIQFTALEAGDHTIALTLSGNAQKDAILLLEGVGTK